MTIKYKAALGTIKAMTEDENYVFIEGYANFSQPDDVKERLDPMTMDDTRYVDNPVLLFNHNTEYVIGKSISWEKKADGVFVKCAISKSTHPDISYVRDLVKEGILKAFSVGFSGGDTEKDAQYPDAFFTKNWKWHELSIVPIPMQAQSLFSTTTKSYGENLRSCKTLLEARVMTLKLKGANVAAMIATTLDPMDPAMKTEALNKIVEVSQASKEQVASVISGDMAEVPEALLGALASVLGLNAEELKAAAAKDAAPPTEEPKAVPPVKPEEKPTETVVPQEQVKPEEKPADPKKPALSKTAEQIQACVSSKVPELMKGGASQEEATAMAVSQCSQEKGCAPSDLTDSDWGEFLGMKHGEDSLTKKEVMTNTGDNLHIQLMQQTVQMLGSIANKMDTMTELIKTYLATEVTTDVQEQSQEAVTVDTAANADNAVKALIREATELNSRLKSYL